MRPFTRLLVALSVLAALGCVGGRPDDDDDDDWDFPVGGDDSGLDDDDSDDAAETGTGDDTSPPDTGGGCDARLEGLSPADGAVDVSVDPVLVATFSEPPGEGATLWIDGVSGRTTVSGDRVTFEPDESLEEGRGYTGGVTACGWDESFRFTTVGGEVDVGVEGHVYDVSLATASSGTLPGMLLVDYADPNHLFLEVESADTSRIDWVGAWGDAAGEQAACSEVMDPAAVSFSGAAVTFGPVDSTFGFEGVPIGIQDLEVNAVLSTDGRELQDVRVVGWIETGTLDELLGASFCDLATSFGERCVRCPSGGTDLCLPFDEALDDGPWDSGLDVDPTVDPSRDPSCE